MCGIAAIVAPEASRLRQLLGRMLDSLRHRGPDGSGEDFFAACALGHRRLSIVDLEGGQQPMRDTTRRLGLTFNGEIYGYRRLRDDTPYDYRTSSDTELLLAAYRNHGEEMLPRLPGMFAFALWDDDQGKLFCARDRFGEKPLYYAVGTGGEFLIASEIKAILASGLIEPKLDRASLGHFLKTLYVPTNRTIYENIHSLPPAHSLTWQRGEVAVHRYWDLPQPERHLTLDDAVDRFRTLISDAVANQLVADVEVGAFLSGGLDSSTIVALACERLPKLKTISFGFGEAVSDLPYAREIAQKYQTEHIEIVDSDVNLAELTMRMAQVYDEPFADSSNVPTFVICQHAAKELKVVLTGDGADELLGGYDFWYRPLYWLDRARAEGTWRLWLAQAAVILQARLGRPASASLGHQSAAFQLRGRGSIADIHEGQNVFFRNHEIAAMGLRSSESSRPQLSGGLDDAMRMDVVDYMPGDILVKTDRASMANGLELRAPFLDVGLASFLISLPASLKIDAEADKKLLRRAFSEKWTPSIRRRSKQGFGAPVSKWLARVDMKALTEDFLLDPRKKVASFVGPSLLRRIAGEGSYQTWILLVLSIWMETHDFAA